MCRSTSSQKPSHNTFFCLLAVLFCFALQTPIEAASPDFNNDGQVNFLDFVLFAQNFGKSDNTTFDLDNSGDIGFGDFIRFVQQFGTIVEPILTNQNTLQPDLGGTISLDNGPQIQVPPGALSGPGTLTIAPIDLNSEQEPQDATRISSVFEIALKEATLTNPVEIAIPYNPLLLPADATINDLHIAWWDGENWRPVPSTVDPQFIRAQVDHFSQWTGVFARTPSAKIFTTSPKPFELQANEIKNLNLNLTVDPAGIRTTDLRVRLTLSLSDNIRNKALGRFTLSDNGNIDPTSAEPIAGLSIRSADTTDPLDGNYGAEITLDSSTLPEQYTSLKATVTLTTRRIASIAIDTTITIPITRLRPTTFAVSGRLLKGGEGVANGTVVLAGLGLHTTTTDANGNYSVSNLEPGVYVMTPAKPDHNFSPANLTISISDTDLTDINFSDTSGGPGFAAGDALELNGNAYMAIDGAFYGGEEQTLTVHTDGAGLPGGTYTAIVQIWSTGGLLELPITLDNGPGVGGEAPNEPVSNLDIITLTTPAATTHKMVIILAGEFTMGSTNGLTNAAPPHIVFLDVFRIAQFEVTNAHYAAFATATLRALSAFANDGRYNDPTQPVVGISHTDAAAYCAWIGGQLPTEAQWEKAARGTDERTYPWGESDPNDNLLNHNRTIGKSSPVGNHPDGASPYGIHDMAGNVWEWTADWYNGTYYENSPTENPTGPTTSPIRVVRGALPAPSTVSGLPPDMPANSSAFGV